MQLYSDIVKARHNVAHDNIEQHKIFREIKKALICNVPLLSRGDITEPAVLSHQLK